ncbi:MAG: hypothetical protein GEV07_03065 [Streptosporangiales bacterium]|nr:hypothetical protein [Streptosporangiales bacterium]
MPYSETGLLADPEFRTERARKAAVASNGAKGVITRFLGKLPELTDEQIETVRRALPPVDRNTADHQGGGSNDAAAA